jgi:hypothetical protein
MRVATGPGKILEKEPSPKAKGRFALLYNFDIDDSQLKAEHQDWLMKNVVPLLTRARTFTVALKGTASRSGAASYNMQLSQRRVEAAEAFLTQNGVKPEQLSRNWVGESEAASFGRLDGSESEEDRAVAVHVCGPELEIPKFIRRNWWNHLDGFDPRGKIPWKMVPAYESTLVRIVRGAGWKLRTSKPSCVYFIDPQTNRPVHELIISTNDQVIRLGGLVPGKAQILGEDVFGVVRPLLDIAVLEAKTVTVAFHYVEDKAKHKTTRKPGEEAPMVAVANRVFKPQANLSVECVHSKELPTKEDWGNPVTYKEMGGEFLPLLGKYSLSTARINVFFVWDYEPGKGDTDAEVDNIGGGGVIFEDKAGNDVGLSMSHEFAHNLGLPHRETRAELLMWPYTDERGGVLEKDQILTVHGKV